jgi:hypothetical protein
MALLICGFVINIKSGVQICIKLNVELAARDSRLLVIYSLINMYTTDPKRPAFVSKL